MPDPRDEQLHKRVMDMYRNDLQGGSQQAPTDAEQGPTYTQQQEALLRMLHSRDLTAKWTAIRRLGEIGDGGAVSALMSFVEDRNDDLRNSARQAIRSISERASSGGAPPPGPGQDQVEVERLLLVLQQGNVWQQYTAVQRLGQIGSPSVVSSLTPYLQYPRAELREGARAAIREIQARAGQVPAQSAPRPVSPPPPVAGPRPIPPPPPMAGPRRTPAPLVTGVRPIPPPPAMAGGPAASATSPKPSPVTPPPAPFTPAPQAAAEATREVTESPYLGTAAEPAPSIDPARHEIKAEAPALGSAAASGYAEDVATSYAEIPASADLPAGVPSIPEPAVPPEPAEPALDTPFVPETAVVPDGMGGMITSQVHYE